MPSAHIDFDSIPSSLRKPGFYGEFNLALAVRSLPGNQQKTLIVGQRLAGAAAVVNTVATVFSDEQAAAFYGRGSIAHLMVKAALKANRYLSLQVISLDDAAAGQAAVSTVTITGPASSSGVLSMLVGGVLVQIPIASGDSKNAIAAALKAQFDNQPDLPATAAVAADVVTLTAKCKGTLGNSLNISTNVTAAGVAAVASAPAGGEVDPDISAALASVFAAGHNIIITPWNDQASLTALRTHLDAVSGALEKRGAVAAYAHVGTLAQATTLAPSINSGRITGILVPGAYEPVYQVAAAYGSVIAFEEDPARPLNTLGLTGITPPPLEKRLGRQEQENALNNGVTPSEVGPGDVVQIVRAVTTYVKNATNTPDISLLDLTTIRSLDYTRKSVLDRLGLRFPRAKKSKRVLKQIREEVLDVLYKLEELEIVENVKENEDAVIVENDLQDPTRANIRIPTDVVNGLHVIGARFDLLL